MFQHKFDVFDSIPLRQADAAIDFGPNEADPINAHLWASSGFPSARREVDAPSLGTDFERCLNVDQRSHLLSCTSSIVVADALLVAQMRAHFRGPPTPEDSGAAILAESDLRDVDTVHLEALRIRFDAVPASAPEMLERIHWMWHAGCRSDGLVRATEARELLVDQTNIAAWFDDEELFGTLQRMAREQPELIAALFRGDLDDAPGLIEIAVPREADQSPLVKFAALMFVSWSALEQQREASLGWRLIHLWMGGAWAQQPRKSWTIGQTLRPRTDMFAFAEEMKDLFEENLARGVVSIDDKRRTNRIKKTLRKFDYDWLAQDDEALIISRFGESRVASLPEMMRKYGHTAKCYDRRYRTFLSRPDGSSRANERADKLRARISAVLRTAIVCARTYNMSTLAASAQTSHDLRAMLDANQPSVLEPCRGKRVEDEDKGRLRQMLHVLRCEFLQDGEHLPKAEKGRPEAELGEPKLELDDDSNRKGREIFDEVWKELNDQPSDWRFVTPLGWQCDGKPRLKLAASTSAATKASPRIKKAG